MANVTVTRRIDAPADVVFRVVAHVEQFSQAVPGILRVEFLSEVKSGVGARFRETRMMMGREASTELEVTEYVENERVRIVSEAGGALWDTGRGRRGNRVEDGDGCAAADAERPDDRAPHHRNGAEGGRGRHGRGEVVLRASGGAVDRRLRGSHHPAAGGS
ncbi:MAG: SRPBCC family protein [Acidobacteria bacterium]|nr:SRPBCC family protein [Acidobacteriota bacterium]